MTDNEHVKPVGDLAPSSDPRTLIAAKISGIMAKSGMSAGRQELIGDDVLKETIEPLVESPNGNNPISQPETFLTLFERIQGIVAIGEEVPKSREENATLLESVVGEVVKIGNADNRKRAPKEKFTDHKAFLDAQDKAIEDANQVITDIFLKDFCLGDLVKRGILTSDLAANIIEETIRLLSRGLFPPNDSVRKLDKNKLEEYIGKIRATVPSK